MYPYNVNPDDFTPASMPQEVRAGDRISAAWANLINQQLGQVNYQDIFREFGVQVREGKILYVYDGNETDQEINLPKLEVQLYDESVLDSSRMPQRELMELTNPIVAFPSMQAKDRLAIPKNGNYDRLLSQTQYRVFLSELYVPDSEILLFHFEGAYYFPVDEFPVIEAKITQNLGGGNYQLESLITGGKLLASNVQNNNSIPNDERVIVYMRKPNNFFDWFGGGDGGIKVQDSNLTVVVDPTNTLTFDADAFQVVNPLPNEAAIRTNLLVQALPDVQTEVCVIDFISGPGISITVNNAIPKTAQVKITALGGGGGGGHHATYLFYFPSGPTAYAVVDTYDFRDKLFEINAVHFTRIPELPAFPDPYIVDDQIFPPFAPGQTFTKGSSWNYWSAALTDAGGPPQNIAANLFGAPAYWRLQAGTGHLMMKYNVVYPGYIGFTVHAS